MAAFVISVLITVAILNQECSIKEIEWLFKNKTKFDIDGSADMQRPLTEM